jgi:heavy metal sensor kinase
LLYQVNHYAIQDVETIEGLLYFDSAGNLSMHEDYHRHPESRRLLERLVEVLSPDGQVLYRNERLGTEALGGAPFPGEGVDKFSARSVRLRDGTRISLVSRFYSLHGRPMIIRLGHSQEVIWSRLRELFLASVTVLPVLLAITAFLGYQLARRALSPLEQMALRAEQITAEHLHQRLPVENPEDELGHLARVINSVFDRLEQSFEQLRRFTSDASHELRTPLAAIRSVGEVGLQKNKIPADYEDTIGSMLEEVTRLTRLVESLLTMSRADAGELVLQLTVFSPMELVREVVGVIEVLADERDQKLVISGNSELSIRGDRLLLRQALINVLHNAVKYSPVGGNILIWIGSRDGNQVVLKVTDSGPGIASEHRQKIFDRFYRVDSGRARDTGGVGLGLSIARWALQVQGGNIRVEDCDEGSTFVLELLSPQAATFE